MPLLLMTSLAALATPRVFQRIDAARVVAAARAQIDARLGSERGTTRVAVVGTPEDMTVPQGVVALSVRPLAGRWPRSRVGVPVEIRVDGRVVRSATVWFALAVHRQALVYAADAPVGALAASLKLVPRDEDVAQMQGTLISDPHGIQGMRLRHPVLAGSAVEREDFEHIPDVDRQERVRVMVLSGSIRMQARGTAMAKGDTGDMVPVLVDNAEAPVQARITDRGVVEVVQ
ncbi:MAG: flagellar basal body P-ring formation protein FlgA [Xanthomonadaceae bacterium]|nr:flagellar basal body P-ring formation protein FlgA [Xanthomonadaceae bacterium]